MCYNKNMLGQLRVKTTKAYKLWSEAYRKLRIEEQESVVDSVLRLSGQSFAGFRFEAKLAADGGCYRVIAVSDTSGLTVEADETAPVSSPSTLLRQCELVMMRCMADMHRR